MHGMAHSFGRQENADLLHFGRWGSVSEHVGHAAIEPLPHWRRVMAPCMGQHRRLVARQHVCELASVVVSVIFHGGRFVCQQYTVPRRACQCFTAEREPFAADPRKIVIDDEPVVVPCSRIKDEFHLRMPVRQIREMRGFDRVLRYELDPDFPRHGFSCSYEAAQVVRRPWDPTTFSSTCAGTDMEMSRKVRISCVGRFGGAP